MTDTPEIANLEKVKKTQKMRLRKIYQNEVFDIIADKIISVD